LGKDGRQRGCGNDGGNVSPRASASKNMYCNVQYIIGRSDYNSIEPVMQSSVKE
jgi:hypothetical protein